MIRILFFVLLSTPLVAQTDTLKHDKWIGWVSPSTMFHFYHPAIEIGAEYNQGKKFAYIVNYGWDIALKRYIPYHGQHHQYLRLGVKKYKRKKLTSGYLMGDIGLFHLSHYGSDVSWKGRTQPDDQVYARFNEFLFKPRVNIGAKLAGDLRLDVFAGLGYRFGFRKHKVIDKSDYPDGPESHIFGMISPAEPITIDRPSGWSSVHAVPFLSLGLRIGVGFKPVKVPVEKSLP